MQQRNDNRAGPPVMPLWGIINLLNSPVYSREEKLKHYTEYCTRYNQPISDRVAKLIR